MAKSGAPHKQQTYPAAQEPQHQHSFGQHEQPATQHQQATSQDQLGSWQSQLLDWTYTKPWEPTEPLHVKPKQSKQQCSALATAVPEPPDSRIQPDNFSRHAVAMYANCPCEAESNCSASGHTGQPSRHQPNCKSVSSPNTADVICREADCLRSGPKSAVSVVHHPQTHHQTDSAGSTSHGRQAVSAVQLNSDVLQSDNGDHSVLAAALDSLAADSAAPPMQQQCSAGSTAQQQYPGFSSCLSAGTRRTCVTAGTCQSAADISMTRTTGRHSTARGITESSNHQSTARHGESQLSRDSGAERTLYATPESVIQPMELLTPLEAASSSDGQSMLFLHVAQCCAYIH